MGLSIEVNITDKKAIMFLKGRLDTSTSPDFEKSTDELVNRIDNLTLDFSNLDYISSAGLRILLKIRKALDKKEFFKLIHVSDEIKEVFDMTGFSDLLTIE